VITSNIIDMHNIEPYFGWLKYYDSVNDSQSPFYQKEHSLFEFTDAIYGYCIHPQWDYIGSETLYIKIIFTDYRLGFAIIELIGEWNDALHNDIMHFKRNIIEHLEREGISKFILIGENVYNFHGSDDSYYEDWFEDLDNGWIVAIGFQDFVLDEWRNYQIDYYINFGGELETLNWRTMKPLTLFEKIEQTISRRIY